MSRLSLRARLTALYAGTFAVAAILLLGSGYLLARHNADRPTKTGATTLASKPVEGSPRVFFSKKPKSKAAVPVGVVVSTLSKAEAEQTDEAFERTLMEFGGLSLGAIVLAAALGYVLAGRALSPIRAMDVTARRVSESNLDERIVLRGPRDEIHRLAETFNSMLDRLSRAFSRQRLFVASASHELRTPMAVARGEIELAKLDPDREATQAGERAIEALDRANALLDGLLELARASHELSDVEELDLAEIVREESERAAQQHPALHFTESISELACVKGRPDLLRTLVRNLLDNATRYNRLGGEVGVLLVATPSVAFVVSNTGPPVPPHIVGELTDPFRRGEPSRARATGGSGLGLAIVDAIAQAHHGRLTLSAKPGGGLLATVALEGSALELPHGPRPAERVRR
jgi:signal transduction histidine kinase